VCLSIPSKVVKIDKQNSLATVDTMGVQRDASIALVDDEELKIGDYVLLHIGFIMKKIDEAEALESLAIYEEIVKKMSQEDRLRSILADEPL
jgi:hydrogenase expression/formation protein HypC